MARRPASPSHGDAPRPAGRPQAPRPLPKNLVQLGEFGRAQGLHGEVRLKSHTGDPLAIAEYGPLTTADGRSLVLTAVRAAPGGASDLLVVKVEGVRDRTGAEALNRVVLYCPRERLGEPEDEDEFFSADLVGLSVVDAAGTAIGTIVAVPNYGGGDLLEIRPARDGPTALLPFTKTFVPTIDIAGRRVVAAPPEGFFAPSGPKPADEPA